MRTIGIVSPGAMGSALGRAWATAGARVVATVVGRSERTAALASGLELLPDLDAVVAAGDLVVSICPPAAAEAVLALGHRGVQGDRHRLRCSSTRTPSHPTASPPSPHRRPRRASTSSTGPSAAGHPSPGSDTMLYLSGARAAEVARVPAVGLRRSVVGDRVGQASAVKMCTASVYKGTTAVWAQALQTAEALDVLAPVLDDLAEELPAQVEGAARRVAVAAAKSARFVDEMESIARHAALGGRLARALRGDGRGLPPAVGHAAGGPQPRGGGAPSPTCATSCPDSPEPGRGSSGARSRSPGRWSAPPRDLAPDHGSVEPAPDVAASDSGPVRSATTGSPTRSIGSLGERQLRREADAEPRGAVPLPVPGQGADRLLARAQVDRGRPSS